MIILTIMICPNSDSVDCTIHVTRKWAELASNTEVRTDMATRLVSLLPDRR